MDDQYLNKETLFYRYCNGVATPEERAQVESLIAGSLQAAEELKLVAEAVSIENEIREIESCDASAAFIKVHRTIRKRRRRSLFLSVVSRAAAVLIIPLMLSVGILSYIILSEPGIEPVFAEITAAPGSISCFELPDHSKVWLNAGSTLRYPNPFAADIREVTLVGEGYFEVQSDEEHPFFVTTIDGIKVMAHGTHFNVNTEDNVIQTVLEEGKVSLFTVDDRLLAKLSPGDQGVYDKATREMSVSQVNLYEKLAWKDRKVVFRNARLSEVFYQLERRYNIDIVLHDDYNQSDKYSARVTFTDETIQQIFSYLEIAAPIRWKLSTPIQNADSTLTKQRIDVWFNN